MENTNKKNTISISDIEKHFKIFLNSNKNLKLILLSIVGIFVLVVSFLIYLKLKKSIFQIKPIIQFVNENHNCIIKEENELSGTEIYLDSSLKQTESCLSFKTTSFEKIQSEVFNNVNSQYLAENLLSQSSKTNGDIILTNLNHISDAGIFMIAPVEENLSNKNHNEKNQRDKNKRKIFFKRIALKNIHLMVLPNKSQNRKRSLVEKLIDNNIKVVFNMNTHQQKHFLEIFGPDKNPILIAKNAFKQKFRQKKSKLKKRIDKINMKNRSKLSLNSICSSYSSMLLEDSLENLDKHIRDFLENPLLNQVRIKKDLSDGLGRNNVIKLRRLIYKHEYKPSTGREMEETNSSRPEITIDIYNVKKVKSLNRLAIQQDNKDQDSNKLVVLVPKKHN